MFFKGYTTDTPQSMHRVHIWNQTKFSTNFIYHSGFSQIDKIGNNANIGIRGFAAWKKYSDKMLPPVGIEPRPLIASDSKNNTILSFYTNLTFACKTET